MNNQKVQQRLWQMFYDMESIQEEWVWFVTRDKDTGWSGDILPPSQGGHARQRPLQEQVDEYEYVGPDGYGYPIYGSRAKADGYDDENPYESVKRDPRFYRDIRYHGSWYGGTQLNTAVGNDAVSGSYLDQASHTGYICANILKTDGIVIWEDILSMVLLFGGFRHLSIFIAKQSMKRRDRMMRFIN